MRRSSLEMSGYGGGEASALAVFSTRCGWPPPPPPSITCDDESRGRRHHHHRCCRPYLQRLAGDGGTLAGTQSGLGDAGDGPLGGESRRRVDEGRAVAKGGAHDARLATNQLLVHVQSHRRWRVGEA